MGQNYFIAVPLPEKIKHQLSLFCNKRKEHYPFRKWVHAQDYHLTVKFLGPCSEAQLVQVRESLTKSVQSQVPFQLNLGKLGTFGKATSPRILWVGIEHAPQPLFMLVHNVAQEMAEIGFENEQRPYKPHITLARTFQGSAFDLPAFAPDDLNNSAWEVDRIVLYRTMLGEQPMYDEVGTYEFL